jgi:tetratricopeptide (TPR) repeat protein
VLPKTLVLAAALAAAACSSRPGGDAPRQPTFARDIAPIVHARCAPCHRPGEAGPFSLLTYSDVASRARQVALVTRSGYMPPWKPEPGHGDFAGERRLTAAELATIQRWVEAGAPEGNAADAPAPPAFPHGWQLGQPDLTVAMPGAVDVPAEGADVYRTVIVPLSLPTAKYVRAVEFRPGNPRVVHHAMVRTVRAGARLLRASARTLDAEGMLGGDAEIVSPDGHVLGWAPGYSPTVMPAGMAWRLEPGAALAIELHLQPTGKAESARATVGLFFTDEPPAATPVGLQLGSYTIDIPPGVRDYTVEDRYEVPVDLAVHAIYPHAHYLGRDVRAWAMLPDGTERPLVWIRDWDFKWQNAYRYRTPVLLPKGTIVSVRFTFDNSAENPRNPSRPPRRVRYGGRSTDEMANVWMQVVPVRPEDLTALRADYQRAAAAREAAGLEALLRDEPGNGPARRALGDAYLRLGRVDQAAAMLAEAVRLAPRDATAHYNLGHALAAKGSLQEAAGHFGAAARLEPSFAEAHNNHGAVLRQAGDLAGAERAFRAAIAAAPDYAPAHNNLGITRRRRGDARGAIAALDAAVRLDPRYADAHLNLGLAYQDAGDRAAATRHLRRAIELQPSDAEAYNALAWLLATAPDRTASSAQEALTLAERAAAITGGRDASALDTLAAALDAAGYRERALEAGTRALQLANASGQRELAAQIARRVSSYRAR